MKTRWTENLEEWDGLDYVRLQGVPMRKSRHGKEVDLKPQVLENLLARALVESQNPLGGNELRFLRRTLGLSLHQFPNKIGITPSAVFHWEKRRERLLPINEIAVRVLCADEFGVALPAKLSRLVGAGRELISLELTRPKKLRKARSKPLD